jgi:hypothetical protein
MILSVLLHVGFFLLAGFFVVFTAVKQKEVEFVLPKVVERPKMKLKKPRVKVKKFAKPSRFTTHIVTRVQKANIPIIRLPEIASISEGFAGGMDGFDLMPNLGDSGIFGSGQTIGNDFVGTFYDFLRDRKGRRISLDKDYNEFLRGFIKSGWKESYFSRYYRSPKKLYATTCMFPCMESVMARVAYGEFEEGQEPNDHCWAILYKGQLVCPRSYTNGITFRFWGMGSSFLIVQLNGETVLDAPKSVSGKSFLDLSWHSKSTESYKYWIGNGRLTVGDWITLKPGEPKEMKYFFSDWGGGEFGANLLVEEKGREYPKNRQGGPILPIFKTEELSHDQFDHIMELLVYDSASLTNGPVFCDYDSTPKSAITNILEGAKPAVLEPFPGEIMRIWTLADGRTLEAKLKTIIMGNVLLETPQGQQQKISFSKLSEADRKIAELARPPEFNIEFSKTFSKRTVPPSHLNYWEQPKLLDYTFGVTLKQTSTGTYNHPLTVEYFAIGKQINGNHTYILLDRQSASFSPANKKRNHFEFHGKPILLFDYTLFRIHMGQKPVSYLITVTDERGKIIQHSSPNEWIFEHLENLKKVPVGRFMNKTCIRTYPERPDIGSRRDYTW